MSSPKIKGIVPEPGFVHEVRRVLRHLYDPVALQRSPLPALLALSRNEGPSDLQRIIAEAIQALRPRSSMSPQASAWRVYRTLSDRYIDQFSQREVATGLGLGIRQMKRQESLALRALADYLWSHYDLQTKWPHSVAAAHQAGEAATPGAGGASSQEQELEWLERSSLSEAAEVDGVLESLLRVVAQLAASLSVSLECTTPPPLPRLAVQLTPMRQAILNVMTAAIHAAPGGRVEVRTESVRREVSIRVQSIAAQASTCALPKNHIDNLEIARQLIGLSGGSLEVHIEPDGLLAFSARLTLPAAGQATVLVVDDNVDTLQLFQRYLVGSRYPFLGVRDPEQALAMAAELGPQIIVLDVMLPGVDGWELLGRLRAHPKTRSIPVIVCTIVLQEQLALSLGAAGFLHKPVSREALLAALDRQLGQPPPGSLSAL